MSMVGTRIKVGVYVEQGKSFAAFEVASFDASNEHRANKLVETLKGVTRRQLSHLTFDDFDKVVQETRELPATIPRIPTEHFIRLQKTLQAMARYKGDPHKAAHVVGITPKALKQRLKRAKALGMLVEDSG